MEIIRNNKKRIISLVLVVLILITSIPIPVIAEEIQNGDENQQILTENGSENGSGEQTKAEKEGDAESEAGEDSEDELNSEELENKVNPLSEEALSEEGKFKVALRWGGTSNPAYTWDATESENRVIKLTFYYQNEVTPRAYAPGELVVTIPGIGKLNRTSTVKASDIAADVYGAAELKRDWSYKYDAATDTYTFYNNHAIEQGETFNGSFEMLYEFTSRNCINDYAQTLKATLTAGDQTLESQELSLDFTSKRDTFYINKTAKSLVSADGLSKYVEEGKTVSDYAWVQYTFRYNVEDLNARALKERYLIDTMPVGCVIARDTNVIKNEDGTVSYKLVETSVPENSYRETSIIVGYPEEYVGQTIDNTVYLNGTYKDEEEETQLAQSTIQVELKKIQNQAVGIVPDKYISPDYIYREALGNDISFSTSLYATATTNAEDEGYTVSVTDDLLEIYTPANTETGTEDTYHTLTDDEYKFTSVTVPGTNSFTNANGYTLTEGDYTVKIYALYKKDVNTRGLDEYTLIHEGKWENTSITKTLEEDAVAIRAEVSGLKESIKSFYISARGIINVSENVANAVYDNPSYIVNYQFTELKDKDGNSLIADIAEENYSQTRLYERDSAIYGKGVLRAQDTISIRERTVDPGYYYARADIEPFSVDENVENFVTKLHHSAQVYNTHKEEISKVEVHGVVEKEDLETYLETLELTHSGLKFKNELSSDTDLVDYLMERATISKEGSEISIAFDFSDNPIVSTNFSIGFTVDAKLKYEEYYESTNPSYTVRTYAYLNNGNLRPQSTGTHNEKTMATASDSESILLALASHQQLIKMVKTQYTDDFVQENAVAPMNTEYTYRLKLRNGYNTLVNTEIVDILEHSELTSVDGENPYPASEWYGTFRSINVTQIENQGLGTKAYYANTLTPDENSWNLMESYQDGIWTTANEVKAIKVEIEGEIAENSIIYVDVNMLAPNDINLEDKKAYNSYLISSDAIDLYTGMQSSYMKNMPSNNVDVRLVQKEYNVEITKTDAVNGSKLSGVIFGLYDTEGNKLMSNLTDILGTTELKGLKEGTYIIKEELVPPGYEKVFDGLVLTIQDGKYTTKEKYTEIEREYYDLTFTSTENYVWTQREDGTWQSDNYNVNSSKATMTSNEFTITKPGTLSFDWAVSSESANYDYVYYTITNVDTNTPLSGTGTSTKIGGNGSVKVYDSLTFNNVTKKLEPGTYKITFTYQKDSSTHTGLDRAFVKNVKVDAQGPVEKEREGVSGEATLDGQIPTIKLNIQNPRAKGSITVYKKDEYLNSNKEEIPLSGVQFELLDTEGNSIAEGTTDANGNIVFEDLDWGKSYLIKEKTSPTGYEVIETNVNTYLSKLNKDKTVTIENIRKEGTAILTKQDEKDKTKLSEAVYGLYAKSNIYDKEGALIHEPDTLIKEVKTNEEGQAIFENLIWGEYYIQEIETVYGYELSEEKYEFTINAETVETNIGKTENEERSKANLQLIKIDEKGNFLPGVEFGLYTEDGKEVIITNTKLGQGELTFTSEGEYAWTQNEDGTWQSNNYNVHSTTTTMTSNEFTLAQQGTINFDWSVSSQGTSYDYAYYTITNIETGETIGGTDTQIGGTSYGTAYNSLTFNHVAQKLEVGTYKIEFTYLKNSSSNSGLDRAFVKNVKAEYEIPNITNENGQLNIQALEWGNYYIKEIKVPQGYEISDTKYVFTVDRETFKTGHNTVSVVENEETGEEISIIRNNRKKGKVTLTKYACDAEGNETETILEGAVYELYSSEGKIIGEYTTNENGQIMVENLDWDSYYFLEKTAPIGYSISDKKISFVVNSKNADFEQELTAYNKQQSGEIKINKTIPAETIYTAHGESTFIFKIVGKDENDEVKVTLYRTITFTEQDKGNVDEDGNLTKTITISDIEPYKYEITEEENYRYELSTIIAVKNAEADEENGKGIINLIQATENKGEISFVNQKTSNSLLTDNGLITNTAQNQYYLIGITSELKTEQSYSIGTILTPSDFKYTLLYSGGQEVEKEASELENVTINGETTYTESVIGNHIANIQATYSGKTYETEIPIKWVMPSDYFTYEVLSGAQKTIAITGINEKYTSPEVLYIPSEYNGYKVTQVAGNKSTNSNKLANISNVKTVEIEEGIEEIGAYAFCNYTNIENVKLPNSLTNIGICAFSGCSNLTSIDMPDSLTSIGNSAFSNCSSLTSIDMPDSLRSIGASAFNNCKGLTSIDLSNTRVTEIEGGAFYGCSNLTSIDMPDSLMSIGNNAFYGCSNLTSIDLSNTEVRSIGDSAFSGCSNLTSIDMPDSLTSIGSSAFYNCSKLESVDLSNTRVTSIGGYAFYGCSSLTSVGDIPDSVTSIGSRAFYNCSKLESIDLSNTGVTRIEGYAFYGCSNLTSVGDIPDSLTSIGEYVFSNCKGLTSIDLSNTGVTSIGNNAFSGCSSLTSIDLPDSLTSIEDNAFYGCSSLRSVGDMPDSLTSIGDAAFQSCSKLESIDLSNTGVISIGNYAFFVCSNLTSIDLPESVTSIGSYAFNNCGSLTSINVAEDNKYYSSVDGVLYNKDKTILIKYPEGKDDLTEYVVPDSVTSIGEYAFKNCSKLESIDLSNTRVTRIESSAFYGCSNLTSIDMPDSVTSIGGSAFYKCSSLTSIDLSNTGVTSIGNSAFDGCSNLTSIDLPDSVTSIGNRAFYGCSNLTSIDMPDSVTSIGVSAFYKCSSLTSIDLSNTGVTSIGDSAFNGCSNLTSIDMPDSLTRIGSSAFYRSDLKTINYYGTEEQFVAITVAGGNTPFTSATVNYILPFEYIVLDENAKTIAITGITGNYAVKERISIPSTFNGYNVVQIGDGTSSLSNMENIRAIEIEDGITTIANQAFTGSTNLEYIGLHTSITNIGANAFSECNDLKEIYYFGTQEEFNTIEIAEGNINVPVNYSILEYKILNSKLKTIAITGVMTEFADTETLYIPNEYYGYRVVQVGGTDTSSSNKLANISNVKTVEIEEGVEEIRPYAFYNYTNIENVKLPNSLTNIGKYAFNGCSSLTSIDLSDSVTSIGDSAFNGCSSLTSIDLSNTGVTRIEGYAFYGCSSLTSVGDIPDSLTGIGERAFYSCSKLESIDLSNTGVTSIGNYAFDRCSNLTSVGDIPDSLTSIGSRAFNNCRKLESIDLSNTGVTSIGNSAFNGCSNLTSVGDIPDSLTSIGESAFSGCSKLESIDLSNVRVTSIEEETFYGCSSLTSVGDMPDCLTSIGDDAFYLCSKLESIDLSNTGVTSIGQSTFDNCSSLTSVGDIPDSLTSIGGRAFHYCSKLESIDLSNTGVTSIGVDAFYGCSNLSSIDLSNTRVRSIGDDAFYNCTGFTNIDLPASVRSIGNSAFGNCSNLKTINYYGTETQFIAITVGTNNTFFTNATVNYITE